MIAKELSKSWNYVAWKHSSKISHALLCCVGHCTILLKQYISHPLQPLHYCRQKCLQHSAVVLRIRSNSRLFFSKIWGPVRPNMETAHQVVTFWLWKGFSWIWTSGSGPHLRRSKHRKPHRHRPQISLVCSWDVQGQQTYSLHCHEHWNHQPTLKWHYMKEFCHALECRTHAENAFASAL